MKWAVTLIALGLTGCAGSPAREMMTTTEQKAAEDMAYCNGIGARTGTDAFVSCRLARAQWRQQSVNNGLQLMAMGAKISADSHALTERPVTCNSSSTPWGTVSTTCY